MISRWMSSVLWSWMAPTRHTKAVAQAQESYRIALRHGCTQAQHAALELAKRARNDGLRREMGGKRAKRVTVLYLIGAGR